MVDRLRNVGSEDLLKVLIELSSLDVFPVLADNIETNRWHMMQRIKVKKSVCLLFDMFDCCLHYLQELPVYARVPRDIPERTRLVITLLHEALEGGHTRSKDAPFALELKAIANVLRSLEDFCSTPKCVTCNHHAPEVHSVDRHV
jgi:hypothetical protein